MTDFIPRYEHQTYALAAEVTAPAYLQWLADLFASRSNVGAQFDGPMTAQIASDLQRLANGEEVLTYEN